MSIQGGFSQLPKVGIGTFQLKSEAVIESVLEATLESGIRLIDSAQCYQNEDLISTALKKLLPKFSLSLSDVVIVSKLQPKCQGKDKARVAIERTVQCFGGYVDVMLIHWPGASKIKSDDPIVRDLRRESWGVLEEFKECGKIGRIGVSNYTLSHLNELLSYCTIKPSVVQNEFHPRYQEPPVLEFCKKHGIDFMGYSPFGQGDLLDDETINKISVKHSVKPANVLVQWSVQNDVTCIPRTSKPERVRENMCYSNFVLDADDLHQMALLMDNHKFCWDPSRVV